MNQDQLRAKALALFHSLTSTWANDLRGNVVTMQDQINRKLDELQEMMAKYEESIDEQKIVAFTEEVGGGATGAGGGEGLGRVRSSMAQLETGSSLTEILGRLIQEVGQFAPRVALFVLKGGACIGWHGHGFDQTPGFSNDQLKRISVPSNADTVFKAVITSRQSFLGESTLHRDNAHLLTKIGNVLPSNIFAMPLVLRDRVAAVVYADSGDSREALSQTEAIEILSLYACKLLDLTSTSKPGRSTAEIQPEQRERISEPPPSQPVAQPPVTPAPVALEPEPSMMADEGDSGTVMLDASSLPPMSSPAVEAPPAVAPPAVEPPADDKQHEDAKRFARLLVSEIKLYNEAKVQEGRKNKDLYQQLKDDIERSRKLYTERHPGAPMGYFDNELVRVLADGDAGALGQ